MTSLKLDLAERGYSINIGKGLLAEIGNYINLERKVFIITDSGVPKEYSEAVFNKCADAFVYTVEEGEGSKSLEVYGKALSKMLELGFTRTDCVIAVGGGVVGDLSAFIASTYMRGIDFYNIPTTLLSMLDSSIGGKTGINLDKTKNIIGTFYQPKAVIIDTDTLKTLDGRLISAGLAEAVKMAVTFDKSLFEFLEKNEFNGDNAEKIIAASLKIKKSVVENDERESGIRKALNFGHTFGHGIEAASGGNLYHGECVALGMLPMCIGDIRERVSLLLTKLDLPVKTSVDTEKALSFVEHDKKASGEFIDAVFCFEAGTHKIEKMRISDFKEHIRNNF